ncbi:P-loop containing nucleoside triphosphate hydrolase protein [Pyronema domesticum]|nr:P-loop containing nucleoside triphosphate hydrolase protein [Pyronema domesticum]
MKGQNIKFCRLDGSMPRKQRDEALQRFQEDPSCLVILVSLMAGGVGINLTCASRVHLMEPHWNPMVELQALDRVHRLGQTRDVVISRYIIGDSFEKDMMERQKKKLELARKSFDAGKPHIMKCDVTKEMIECLKAVSDDAEAASPMSCDDLF